MIRNEGSVVGHKGYSASLSREGKVGWFPTFASALLSVSPAQEKGLCTAGGTSAASSASVFLVRVYVGTVLVDDGKCSSKKVLGTLRDLIEMLRRNFRSGS